MSERASCPCKLLSLRLSSQTAAEFGDLHRIVEATSKSNSNHDTALQLAAQHGNTSVTAYLLYKMEPSFDALTTPLHRASFSGAVSTMRLILDFAKKKHYLKELLFAPDESFGDRRNSLHKAAAGGRFLAVHCLLEYCSETDLLLKTKDGQGETARDIAVSLRLQQVEEARSVARWNMVAGGQPDWDKCVQLLRRAEFQSKRPKSEKNDKLGAASATSPICGRLVVCGLLGNGREMPDKHMGRFVSFCSWIRSRGISQSPLPSATFGDLFPVPEKYINESNEPSRKTNLVPPEPHETPDGSPSVALKNDLGQKMCKMSQTFHRFVSTQ